MEPKISVIMSVYNDEKYLEKAIESILNQTYSNFEFIICNDCSTDNSEKIIQKFVDVDKRIVYIKNEKNMGLAASLNKCISYSKAPFLARMDSDDISSSTRLYNQLEFLENNEQISVVGSNAKVIDSNGNIRHNLIIKSGKVTLKECLRKSMVIHPTVMMKKQDVINVGMYSVNTLTQRAEDYDLWCKLVRNGYQLYNLNEFLFYYREDIDGIKKRKYKFRIQEFKIKFYWNKKEKYFYQNFPFIIKPLIVGLLPKTIYMRLRGK